MKLRLLKEVLANIAKRPVTLRYPVVREANLAPGYRGKHYADLSKCVGCSLCAIDCPASAITMEKLPHALKHNPRGVYPVVDYGKCVFCYHCVFICPVKAYISTEAFEMADRRIPDSREPSLATIKGPGLQA